MFVKHSFGVKYPIKIISLRVSHPSTKLRIMTAAFAPRPPLFTTTTPDPIAEPQAPLAQLPRRQAAEIYRIRRLVAVALLAGVVIGVLSFGRQADAIPTPGSPVGEAVVVVVQPGDTLWAIARSLDPQGDPRGLVDELSRLVDASSLQPGQRIMIPAQLLE